MSSGEFQGNGSNSKPFSFGQRNLDSNMQPTEHQSGITGGPKSIPSRSAIGSYVFHSASKPLPSAMEKNEFTYQRVESIQNIAEYSPKTRPTSRHSYDGPYPSDLLDVSHSVRIPVSFAMEKNKPTHQRAESIQNIAEYSPEIRPTSRHSYDGPYPSDFSDVSHSVRIPVSFAMEENKPIHQRAESLPKPRPFPRHIYDEPYPSELLPPETKTGAFSNRTSKSKGKDGKYLGQNRVPPFKEFTLKLSDLPLTKEKIAESLSLAEACGFLPYLMVCGRDHLRLMEHALDQVSIEMQMAVRDARNICILLENAPVDTPEDIKTARVQTEKLMHLIITSYRIYIKIDESGKALKQGLHKHKKYAKDFHSSLDNLIEFIFKSLLEKCLQIETFV